MLGDPFTIAPPGPPAELSDEEGPVARDSPSPPSSTPTDDRTRARHVPSSPLGNLVAAGSDSPERERYRSRSQSSLSRRDSWTPSSPPGNRLAASPRSHASTASPALALGGYFCSHEHTQELVEDQMKRRSKIERTMGVGADSAHMVLGNSGHESEHAPPTATEHRLPNRISMTPTLGSSSLDHGDNGSSSGHPLLQKQPLDTSIDRGDCEAICPTERAVLNRRTMKLQRVLGEVLSEEQVGTHIVEPAKNSRQHQPLPQQPQDEKREESLHPDLTRKSIWTSARQDDHPQPEEFLAEDSAHLKGTLKAARRLSSSIPLLGKLFKSHGLEDDTPSESASGHGLQIMVHRSQVSDLAWQQTSPVLQTRNLHKRNSYPTVRTPLTARSDGPASPSIKGQSREILFSSNDDDDDSEDLKVLQRKQLGKLHRLLGTKVPVEMLFATEMLVQSPVDIAQLREASLAEASRVATSRQQRTLGQRLKSTLSLSKHNKPLDVLPIARGSFFMAPAVFDDPVQKQAAMKKASKLRDLFGEHPPLMLTNPPTKASAVIMPDSPLLSRHSIADTSSLNRDYGTFATFNTYRKSLASLEYLAGADPDGLRDLVAALQIDPAAQPEPALSSRPPSGSNETTSPVTPEFNKHSFPIYRRRAGKLKWLLGNTIAAQIGSLDATQSIANDALLDLVGGLEWAAERDAREGLLAVGDLHAIRAQADKLRVEHQRTEPVVATD